MDEEFTHGGGEGEFWRFAQGGKAGVKGPNEGVVAGSDQSGHVESVTNGSAAAMDMALTAIRAAISIEGSKARKSGNLGL